MDSYRTVLCESKDEFVVKRSRFIGHIKPVTTPQEAVEFIDRIKSEHWDATHNVYAYVLREGQIRRYSDDGEPQGTAGIPTLDVLMKENLTDCVVVTTRYFGGVMLGAGGLVRAYSHSAKIAADAGKMITMTLCTVAEVNCDYAYYGKLSALIPEMGGVIENTEFQDNVKVQFRIAGESYGLFEKALIDTSNGKFSSVKTGERYAQM